jgi:hypothetical protein
MSEYLDINIQNGQLYTSDGNKLDINQKECKVVITKPRNIKQHRHVMKMCDYTMKNMKQREGIKKVKQFLLMFKDTFGYYLTIPKKSGEPVRDYESFSFESMDNVKFEPISEELKQFCYAVLNHDNCNKKTIQGLIDIEF